MVNKKNVARSNTTLTLQYLTLQIKSIMKYFCLRTILSRENINMPLQKNYLSRNCFKRFRYCLFPLML